MPRLHSNITTRLIAGFGALILLGAGVAGYAVVQLAGVRTEVNHMQALATNVQRVLESNRLLELQRRSEFEFRTDGEDATLTEGRNAETKILGLLEDVIASTAQEGQRAALAGVAQALRDHGQTVATFAELSAKVMLERQKLLADSDNVVQATSKIADQARSSSDPQLWTAAGDLERSILLVRVSQWRNSATTEKKGLMNFKRAADTAGAAINSLDKIAGDEIKRSIPVLRSSLASYVGTFNQSFADRLTMAGLINDEMRPQIAAVLQQLSSVSDSMKADFAASAGSSDATLQRTSLIQETLAVAVVVIGVLLALSIGRAISRPIGRMTAAMRRLAQGDLAVDVPGLDRRDEVGSMAEAVNVFKANGLKAQIAESEASGLRRDAESDRMRNDAEKAREAAEDNETLVVMTAGLEALAEGDLTYRIEQELSPKSQRLGENFNATSTRLRKTLATIASAIASMRTRTSEVGRSADLLSKRTEQQAASLEETAAALDEVTTTVRKTADSANHAQQLVATAKAAAERSGDVVHRAVEAMTGIERSSNQITQIVGVIDEIALQTNLLALNAGVEAARAGDAGRGFAVVASEVRALAQRSADAAKEIKSLIFSSSEQVEQGVDLVAQTGEALAGIVAQVAEINGIVSEIAASAQEQATGLGQVNTAINHMDEITQQNAAMVEESTAASHALSQDTDELAGLIAQFKIGEITRAPVASARRPGAVTAAPVAARSAVRTLKSVGRGGAVRKPAQTADDLDWQEF